MKEAQAHEAHLRQGKFPHRKPNVKKRQTHKPGSVLSCHLSGPLLTQWLMQPTHKGIAPESYSGGQPSFPCLFGLATRQVYRAIPLTRNAVGSYPAFSPLSASWRTVCFL